MSEIIKKIFCFIGVALFAGIFCAMLWLMLLDIPEATVAGGICGLITAIAGFAPEIHK